MIGLRLFKYASIFALVIFSVVFVPSVLAVGRPNGLGSRFGEIDSTPSSIPQRAQNHLSDTKLKACQAKQDAIRTRSTHLVQLATTMQEKFDAIAGRVEKYYTTKVLPGHTVTNYDNLVANITVKKTAVQVALTKTQNDATNFNCDGEDPKGQMTQYRKDMQSVIQALKDYRTSIKNLIVAVRSITGTTEKASPSPQP